MGATTVSGTMCIAGVSKRACVCAGMHACMPMRTHAYVYVLECTIGLRQACASTHSTLVSTCRTFRHARTFVHGHVDDLPVRTLTYTRPARICTQCSSPAFPPSHPITEMARIRVFVTGGIGGFHRGGENSMGVSADLTDTNSYTSPKNTHTHTHTHTHREREGDVSVKMPTHIVGLQLHRIAPGLG